MTLTFTELQAITDEIQCTCQGSVFVDFSVITPRKFALVLKKDHILKIVFSLQEPFLYLHLTKQRLHSTATPWTQNISQRLNGCYLQGVEVLNNDRIVSFSFDAPKHKFALVIELLPKKPNILLLNEQQKIVSAFHPVSSSEFTFPPKPLRADCDKGSSTAVSRIIEERYEAQEKEAQFLKNKRDINTRLKRLLHQAQKRILCFKMTLEKAENWPRLFHEAQLLQAHFSEIKKGMESITLQDWEYNQTHIIALDKKLSPGQQLEKKYAQSKKLKQAIPHAQKGVDLWQEKIAHLQRLLEELESVTHQKDLAAFEAQVPPIPYAKDQKLPSLPYHEYHSQSGMKIWVGKTAKKNDELTFSLAHGLDWWFHIRDFPGAHVIVKSVKGRDLDPETLQDAAQIALRYSRAKDQGEADVCMTQCKYVKRMGRKNPGKVQLSKYKNFHVKLDNQRWERLKSIPRL